MSDRPLYVAPPSEQSACDHCGRRTHLLFQVAHPETATHWRCVRCLRDLVTAETGPRFLMVTGVALPSRTQSRTDIAAIGRAVDAAHRILHPQERPAPTPWICPTCKDPECG